VGIEHRVTDRVHTAVHRPQPPSAQPVLDRSLPQPNLNELPMSDATVLPIGEFPDLGITWAL
jgi:hypothetical protein